MANDKDFIVKNAVEVGKDTKVTLGTISSSDIDLSTGNYFSDTLAANTTYTISNAGDVQSFQLEVTGGADTHEISNASYSGTSLSVSSQDGGGRDLAIKSDGTKLFMIGSVNDRVYEYDLSTANDLSTASFSQSFTVTGGGSDFRGLDFKTDGTIMYCFSEDNNTVYQFTLSTAWDVSTASYASKNKAIGTQSTFMSGMKFSSDGTKMYALGNGNDTIYEYDLSTAWDVSTASYNSVSLDVSGQDTVGQGLAFKDDGTRMFMVGQSSDSVHQYTLSTAWDLSTASYDSVSLSFTEEDTSTSGIVFTTDGKTLLYVGYGQDKIYEYTGTSSSYTLTWPSSIEWAGGVAPAAPSDGETDVFTISTDDSGVTYVGVKTADNLS
jgi:6-phosphogluconolactonase (cycloisomerase 2 family)